MINVTKHGGILSETHIMQKSREQIPTLNMAIGDFIPSPSQINHVVFLVSSMILM